MSRITLLFNDGAPDAEYYFDSADFDDDTRLAMRRVVDAVKEKIGEKRRK